MYNCAAAISYGMNKYSMTCPCGDVMEHDAASMEDAVAHFKGVMTPDAVAAHFAEKHAGQPVPPMEEIAAGIAASVKQVS